MHHEDTEVLCSVSYMSERAQERERVGFLNNRIVSELLKIRSSL